MNKLSPSKITYCLFQPKSARSVETASLCNLKRSLKDPFNVSRESHNSGLTSAASLSLHTHQFPLSHVAGSACPVSDVRTAPGPGDRVGRMDADAEFSLGLSPVSALDNTVNCLNNHAGP